MNDSSVVPQSRHVPWPVGSYNTQVPNYVRTYDELTGGPR